MSSVEIADLTGKNHFDVKRDILNVLSQVKIDASRFAGIYVDKINRKLECFNLPRRECDLVVSGYSAKYRLAIIDRWHELESKPKQIQSSQTITEKIKQYKALGEEIEGMKESAIGVLEALGIEVVEKGATKLNISRDGIIKSLISKTSKSGYKGVHHHRNDDWMIRFERKKVVYYGGAKMTKQEAIQKRIEMEIMFQAGADMSSYITTK